MALFHSWWNVSKLYIFQLWTFSFMVINYQKAQMMCKQKQIQCRRIKQTVEINQVGKLRINAKMSKPITNKNKFIQDQKSYEIDAWNNRTNSKFCQMENISLFHLTGKQKKQRKLIKKAKQGQLQQSKDKYPTKAKNGCKRAYNLENLDCFQLNQLRQGQVYTPIKLDMIEHSFKLQQYERQKAQQMKNVFLGKLANQDLRCVSSKFQTKKNFIDRNKRYLLQIQNEVGRGQYNLQKNRPIQQTKQQLILNNQKLKEQSKQLNKFISMKQQKKVGKLREHGQSKSLRYKPTASFWSMSYYQKTNNSQLNKARSRRIHYSNCSKSMKQKVSDKDQRANLQVRNTSSQKQQVSNSAQKQIRKRSMKSNQQDQTQNKGDTKSSTTNFNRLLKLKNKSSVVTLGPKAKNLRGSTDQDLVEYLNNRIHSLTTRGYKVKKQKSRSGRQSRNPLLRGTSIACEDAHMSIHSGLQSAVRNRKKSKPRSISAGPTHINNRSKPHHSITSQKNLNRRLTKKVNNYCVQGTTYSMNQTIL